MAEESDWTESESAQGQAAEWARCSRRGSSVGSQPSSLTVQRKHWVLSGESGEGR